MLTDCTAKLCNFVCEKLNEYNFTKEEKEYAYRGLPDWLADRNGEPKNYYNMQMAQGKEILETFLDNFYFPKEMQTFIKFDHSGRQRVHENYDDYCLNIDRKGLLTVDHGTKEGSILLIKFDVNKQKEHRNDNDIVSYESLCREIFNNLNNAIKNYDIKHENIPLSLTHSLSEHVPGSWGKLNATAEKLVTQEIADKAINILDADDALDNWVKDCVENKFQGEGQWGLCVDLDVGVVFKDFAPKKLDPADENTAIVSTYRDTERPSKNEEEKKLYMLEIRLNAIDNLTRVLADREIEKKVNERQKEQEMKEEVGIRKGRGR